VRRIGIFGGTFNPVHAGHVLLAEGALKKLSLDKLIWVPARVPPHKRLDEGAPAADRYRMVKLATAKNRAFTVSRVELDRPGPSYSIDTVIRLQRKYRKGEWYFLVGADAAAKLTSWRKIARLRSLVRFATVPRPGSRKKPAAWVLRLPVKTREVSASDIRRRIREGRSVRGLVPEPVRAYIEKKGLYL
jgi:nicotinate-nucleotide adenylyltransferase